MTGVRLVFSSDVNRLRRVGSEHAEFSTGSMHLTGEVRFRNGIRAPLGPCAPALSQILQQRIHMQLQLLRAGDVALTLLELSLFASCVESDAQAVRITTAQHKGVYTGFGLNISWHDPEEIAWWESLGGLEIPESTVIDTTILTVGEYYSIGRSIAVSSDAWAAPTVTLMARGKRR